MLTNQRSCCENISHIPKILATLPVQEELEDLTRIFKALSDPIRVKILFALMNYEICVGELVNLLELPQTNVSHQLKILRKYNIVIYKKDKKMSFYQIKDETTEKLLSIALNAVSEKEL